jgi:RNA polymerase sigma factor (sigma-70 family)
VSPPSSEPSSGIEQSRWFLEEVRPHEASLRFHLRSSFPTARDVDDVVQESYLRIWKARAARPIQSAKAFLFKVARHVAIDLVRRQRVSPLVDVTDLVVQSVIEEKPSAAEIACTRDEIVLLAQAIDALPPRCREIVILRKLRGLPQKAIAAQLGISVQTVQVQVLRGVKRCEAFLAQQGVQR